MPWSIMVIHQFMEPCFLLVYVGICASSTRTTILWTQRVRQQAASRACSHFFYYVPLLESLRQFWSHPDVTNEISKSHKSNNGILRDFCDSRIYKLDSVLPSENLYFIACSMTTCQKCRDGMYEQQFSNSLTVPHVLWSELDSGGTTGIGNQDQVIKTTWCHSSWFLYNLCEIELDKLSYRVW